MSLLATSFSDPPKKLPEIKNDYEKYHQKNFQVQKINLKLAPSIRGLGDVYKRQLLVFLAMALFMSVATIKDLSRTIQKEQYLRICPEPYICVIPPESWDGQVPMGLTYYKRIPV